MKLEGSITNVDYLITQLKNIAEGADILPIPETKPATVDELAKVNAVRLQALNMLMTLWATKNEL